MSGFAALLGDKLVDKSGEVTTDQALSGKKAVALYFSAHWCPPCRGFTPEFAKWYTKDLKDKGLEVVFVSSDQDESAFKEYYGEMPWLAVPYANKEVKSNLDKKYKIQGIPSVIILSPEGELVNKDGRAAISSDPTGDDLPWKPPTFDEVFSDAKLISGDGEPVLGSSLKGKVFGLYFSAHWCPPCRGFTPQFAEWYKRTSKAKMLRLSLCHLTKMITRSRNISPSNHGLHWILSTGNGKANSVIYFKFEVSRLLLLLTKMVRRLQKMAGQLFPLIPQAQNFLGTPKPVKNLKAGPGSINECPTIFAFCETADVTTQAAIEEALTPIAKKYIDEAKTKGEDNPAFAFTLVTENAGLTGRIREMLKLPELAPATPQLMLLDIPDQGGYYEGPQGEITTDTVEKLLADNTAKSLERKQLE